MKYIRGFLMAWGMFCWIPCPYKKWNPQDRKAQIAMFPLVGACIGVIVCLVWWATTLLGAGMFITGACLTGTYFLLTGFIHLDGFMDCSDAVMPRHPDIEERKRILKDSTNGAFAVACTCVMFVIFVAGMIEIAPLFSLKACCLLVVIFTCSRFVSALEIMVRIPMATSQYADPNGNKPLGNGKDTIPSLIILIVIFGAVELIMADGAWWAILAELYSNIIGAIVLTSAVITCEIDTRKLGGMNGDISGHMITISEMFGVLAMALII